MLFLGFLAGFSCGYYEQYNRMALYVNQNFTVVEKPKKLHVNIFLLLFVVTFLKLSRLLPYLCGGRIVMPLYC